MIDSSKLFRKAQYCNCCIFYNYAVVVHYFTGLEPVHTFIDYLKYHNQDFTSIETFFQSIHNSNCNWSVDISALTCFKEKYSDLKIVYYDPNQAEDFFRNQKCPLSGNYYANIIAIHFNYICQCVRNNIHGLKYVKELIENCTLPSFTELKEMVNIKFHCSVAIDAGKRLDLKFFLNKLLKEEESLLIVYSDEDGGEFRANHTHTVYFSNSGYHLLDTGNQPHESSTIKDINENWFDDLKRGNILVFCRKG